LVCDDFNLDEELETDIGSSKRIAEKIVIARLHQEIARLNIIANYIKTGGKGAHE